MKKINILCLLASLLVIGFIGCETGNGSGNDANKNESGNINLSGTA